MEGMAVTENAAADTHPADEYVERLQVVLNDEEQYSIWPAHKAPPAGWRSDGYEGTREMCLAHIEVVWTDMRPLSVRRQLADNSSD
jgi:MbtH protein